MDDRQEQEAAEILALEEAEEKTKRVYELWEQWKEKLWRRAMVQVQKKCVSLNLEPVAWVEENADESGDEYSELFKRSLESLFADTSTKVWIGNLYVFTKEFEDSKLENFENACARIMHAAESNSKFIVDIESEESSSDSEGEEYIYPESDEESETEESESEESESDSMEDE